jgi:thioredoxin-related protein
MMRMLFAVVSSGVLASCGGGGGPAGLDEPPVDPFSPSAIPPSLRGDGRKLDPLGELESLRNDAGTVMNPDQISYTDPDAEDPDDIPVELRDLLAAPTEEGPWGRSITRVLREARRTDKPVLIWFTDSGNPMAGRAIGEDLFSRRDFEDWAQETFVRLQVDQQVGSKLENEAARKADFVSGLKKRYKVFGYPTLIVLEPSGEVVGRYRGYQRGEWEYKWGQLRQAAFLAKKSHAEWKRRMEDKGHRTWTGAMGRTIFAKLLAYRDGELVLLEPDGTRARTTEDQLSAGDREWIAAEKRKRGIE